jgi:hypothetical protein
LHVSGASFKPGPVHLEPSFKLGPNILLLYSTPSTFVLHLPSANNFFKIAIITVARAFNWNFFSTDPEPICIHQSRLINVVSFLLFGLLFFKNDTHSKNEQKWTKEGRYTFQWLWMKWRVVSIGCQLEFELVPTEHDLDYQCVYICCCYIYQNNWILIVIVIFQFVWHYFRTMY